MNRSDIEPSSTAPKIKPFQFRVNDESETESDSDDSDGDGGDKDKLEPEVRDSRSLHSRQDMQEERVTVTLLDDKPLHNSRSQPDMEELQAREQSPAVPEVELQVAGVSALHVWSDIIPDEPSVEQQLNHLQIQQQPEQPTLREQHSEEGLAEPAMSVEQQQQSSASAPQLDCLAASLPADVHQPQSQQNIHLVEQQHPLVYEHCASQPWHEQHQECTQQMLQPQAVPAQHVLQQDVVYSEPGDMRLRQPDGVAVLNMLPGGYLTNGLAVAATPPPPAEPLDVSILEAAQFTAQAVPSTDSNTLRDMGGLMVTTPQPACMSTCYQTAMSTTPFTPGTAGFPAMAPGYMLPYDPAPQLMAPGMFDGTMPQPGMNMYDTLSTTPHMAQPGVHPSLSESGTSLNTCTTPAPEGLIEVLPSPMVYPTVYVSPAGLLTVLLQHDVAVEMTIDRTIRVVNHRHKSVAATSSRGNSSCIYHAGAKLYQHGTTVEAEVFWERRARMTSDSFLFASGPLCFELVPAGLKVAEHDFTDLSKDTSVTLLFSASGYGPHLVEEYERIAERSKYRYHDDGGVTIYTNGVKIYQNPAGDVTVTSGRKRIRVSPTFGSLYVDTHFVEMAVEMNWNIKVRRGAHRLHASFVGFVLTDGHKECGFDAYRQVFCQPVLVKMHTIFWNGMGSYNMQQPEWYDRLRPRGPRHGPHGPMPPPLPPPPPHYHHHPNSRLPSRAPRRRPFSSRTPRMQRDCY